MCRLLLLCVSCVFGVCCENVVCLCGVCTVCVDMCRCVCVLLVACARLRGVFR